MIYPKISLNKLEVELEKAFAKSEWEDVKKNIENEKREKKSELDVAKQESDSHIPHMQNSESDLDVGKCERSSHIPCMQNSKKKKLVNEEGSKEALENVIDFRIRRLTQHKKKESVFQKQKIQKQKLRIC